jgi:hypothetical protein
MNLIAFMAVLTKTSTMIVCAILPPCLNNDSTLSLNAIMAILRTPTMTINALRHNDLTMTQLNATMAELNKLNNDS